MAKVFLDTNAYLDIIQKRRNLDSEYLNEHRIYISPLSCHILFYVYKLKVPDTEFNTTRPFYNLIDLNQGILHKALMGPTKDLEDNIQLHSAATVECDYFLTFDEKILAMKFFGKTRMVSSLKK